MKYICDILLKDTNSLSPHFNLNFLVPDGNNSSPSDAPAATNYLQGIPFLSGIPPFFTALLFLHYANAKILTHNPEFSLLSCSPPSQGEERELILPESRGKREKGKKGSPPGEDYIMMRKGNMRGRGKGRELLL